MDWTDPKTFKDHLIKVVQTPMPFGRFKGLKLCDLPEPYLVWFFQRGLPDGELGELLGLMYEIKSNGLEHLLRPLKGKHQHEP